MKIKGRPQSKMVVIEPLYDAITGSKEETEVDRDERRIWDNWARVHGQVRPEVEERVGRLDARNALEAWRVLQGEIPEGDWGPFGDLTFPLIEEGRLVGWRRPGDKREMYAELLRNHGFRE